MNTSKQNNVGRALFHRGWRLGDPRLALLALLVVLTGCASSAKNGSNELAARLDEVLHRMDAKGVVVGARVVDLADGKELYASGADRPMIPASNLKVTVSSAALDRFGPDHRFKTYLAMDGDDLWLIGTGDPAAGDPKIAAKEGGQPTTFLDQWAQALRSKGVTRVKGNLYYFDGALDSTWVHPSWSKSFLVDWYAAPVTGLNLNDNCIDVTVRPTKDGQPVTYEVMPPTRGVKIINRCVTGAKDSAAIERAASENVYTLTGTCTKETTLQSKPVTDPGLFFADALRTRFEAIGIAIDGKTLRAASPLGGTLQPPSERIVAVHETTMQDLLSRLNKNSQNLFAEALCKMLGRQMELDQGRDLPGSWESGGLAVRQFLKKQGIDDRQFVSADGSGLSRDNRVTARLMSDLFAAMFHHEYGDLFRETLAVAGRDGTIGKRMKDIEGHVMAKTGFIGGVRALSGYVKTRQGRWLAFSFLYNSVPGDVKPVESLQDEACRLLVNWGNGEAR